jgi:hypothetical protein
MADLAAYFEYIRAMAIVDIIYDFDSHRGHGKHGVVPPYVVKEVP